MRVQNLLVAAAVLGVLAPLPLTLRSAGAVSAAVQRSDVIPVSQVKKGMKGYGLTVFEGTEPEKFDVEVIDVLENFLPDQDLILVKTKHPRLEVAKVVAGMSGSPIYLNGKMAGAYAYGWTFGKEPVAGVTPIRSMIEDLERPLPKSINGWPLKMVPGKRGDRRTASAAAFSTSNRFAGRLGDYDVEAHREQVAVTRGLGGPSTASPVKPVATPLLVGGMTSGSIRAAKDLFGPLGLEPLQAGGSGKVDPSAPKRFVDGGAIGVQLVRGDVSMQGLGTVTRVEGDRLVAFGHPMMSSGVTAMPTAVGKVLWFLASQMRSFKIGVPVRPVGALVNDRRASIVVSHSAQAPTVPVRLKITGLPEIVKSDWNMEVAHERFMTPSLLAIAMGNAVESVAADKRDVTWNVKSRLKIRGHAPIEIEDFGVSIGSTPGPQHFFRTNLVGAVGMILSNPWGPEIVERVDVELEIRFSREIFRLTSVEVVDSEIDPGQPARVRLKLEPYSGKAFYKVVKVPLPKSLAGQTVTMQISPGYMHPKPKAEPNDVAELLQAFEDMLYPPRSIMVTYGTAGGGLAFQGHVVENLPVGVIDGARPTTTSEGPAAFSTPHRHIVPLDQFMVGQDTVSVQIKPPLR